MEKLYKYTDDMLFDFVSELPDEDRNDFQNETALAVEGAIQRYFEKMGEYGIYFRLTSNSVPGGNGVEFEVVGTMENLMTWCTEEWKGDTQLLQDSAELLN